MTGHTTFDIQNYLPIAGTHMCLLRSFYVDYMSYQEHIIFLMQRKRNEDCSRSQGHAFPGLNCLETMKHVFHSSGLFKGALFGCGKPTPHRSTMQLCRSKTNFYLPPHKSAHRPSKDRNRPVLSLHMAAGHEKELRNAVERVL